MGARADVAGDPERPDLNIAWKYLWTAKDTWLGPEQNLGAIGALYNLTMDPFEKYDMVFNGAMSTRLEGLSDEYRLRKCDERSPAVMTSPKSCAASGNRAPDKRKATHHIDGTVALVMALAMGPQVKPFDLEALIG